MCWTFNIPAEQHERRAEMMRTHQIYTLSSYHVDSFTDLRTTACFFTISDHVNTKHLGQMQVWTGSGFFRDARLSEPQRPGIADMWGITEGHKRSELISFPPVFAKIHLISKWDLLYGRKDSYEHHNLLWFDDWIFAALIAFFNQHDDEKQ